MTAEGIGNFKSQCKYNYFFLRIEDPKIYHLKSIKAGFATRNLTRALLLNSKKAMELSLLSWRSLKKILMSLLWKRNK